MLMKHSLPLSQKCRAFVCETFFGKYQMLCVFGKCEERSANTLVGEGKT